ncbi:hypothetical protein [Kitasatospora sp. NPDC087314]|uniref:hypothetical protein n=1 Tax=Kitasatospora sp. NPDC087314 TaxID=3364068 RepID=UPI0037F219F4
MTVPDNRSHVPGDILPAFLRSYLAFTGGRVPDGFITEIHDGTLHWPATPPGRAGPTWPGFHTAREKNRCARDQWACPASPVACRIPVTVCGPFPDGTPVAAPPSL